jgi:pilus assembly protein CpaF
VSNDGFTFNEPISDDYVVKTDSLQNAEEGMIENDAKKYTELVIKVLNEHHQQLVIVDKWDEAAILRLETAVKSILHSKDYGEYRNRVIDRVIYYISSVLFGVDILQPLMDNPEITEIEVVEFDRIYCVDFKGRRLTDIKFPSADTLDKFVTRLTDRSGLSISPENPIADFALPNKTRVNIVGKWASVKRIPYLTMRKPPTAVRQVKKSELLDWGALIEDMVEAMQLFSDGKMNVLLSGETNSGKTTYIRLLMDMIDKLKMERIILIQDTPEIDPDTKEKIFILLQTINRKVEPVTFFDLLKSTLRMNPDRTWIGEIRGIEAAEMLESNLAGARGTLASGHADSPRNMIMRLVILMYRAGFNFGEHIIRQIIHQSLDFIYQTRIMPDGSKKIVEITEILPLDIATEEGSPTGLRVIFEYRLKDVIHDENKKIIGLVGEHVIVNPISNYRRKKLLLFGIRTPDKFGGAPSWN